MKSAKYEKVAEKPDSSQFLIKIKVEIVQEGNENGQEA